MTDSAETYAAWLRRHATSDPCCVELTQEMAAQFPELRRVRGHYFCPMLVEYRPHWWCETSAGEILDPTADQFPSRGLGEYIEHTGPEPTGKCPNCGGYCYNGRPLCSEACEISYTAYLMGGLL